MEMDGLDSAKYQKSRRRDMMGILEMFNDNETKHEQYHLLHLEAKWAEMGNGWNGFCR